MWLELGLGLVLGSCFFTSSALGPYPQSRLGVRVVKVRPRPPPSLGPERVYQQRHLYPFDSHISLALTITLTLSLTVTLTLTLSLTVTLTVPPQDLNEFTNNAVLYPLNSRMSLTLTITLTTTLNSTPSFVCLSHRLWPRLLSKPR